MSQVTELGYVGIGVSNLAKWKQYASDIIGAQWLTTGDKTALLRLDLWHYRIAICEDGTDDLAYLGWRVKDRKALAQLVQKLTQAGIEVRHGSEAEAAERHVLGLAKLISPGGVPTELFWGPRIDAHSPFHPGRPMFGRFKTGTGGMGHVAINEPDVEAAKQFYELLGLSGDAEYKLGLPNGIVAMPVFMHCNERQHSVGFGLGPMRKRINHMMLEYTELDDVGLAHDLTEKNGIDVVMKIGKHSNDGAFSYYMGNPSGWAIELGWDVKKTNAQQEYYCYDTFGHVSGATGYGLDMDARGDL